MSQLCVWMWWMHTGQMCTNHMYVNLSTSCVCTGRVWGYIEHVPAPLGCVSQLCTTQCMLVPPPDAPACLSQLPGLCLAHRTVVGPGGL